VSLVPSRPDYGHATLCGPPHYQCRQLQSVLNAAAESKFRLQRSDHVTPALTEMHWLSGVDRVNFKVATLIYRCPHGIAQRYLSSAPHGVAEVETRRRARSSTDNDILLTPWSRLVTVGDRPFPVIEPRRWNSLSETLRTAPSLSPFKWQLKTVLFSCYYYQ
jgi:hypothetical protein